MLNIFIESSNVKGIEANFIGSYISVHFPDLKKTEYSINGTNGWTNLFKLTTKT